MADKLKNYSCEGQISIFDYIDNTKAEKQEQISVGEWIANHGQRVKFKDIEINKSYVVDYSTCSNRYYKVILVKNKTDDAIMYVDNEKGIKGKWSWGNSYSCMTRQMYVDADSNKQAGENCENGWFFELPKEAEYELQIKGICDDPVCPKCGYEFWTESKRNEVDMERCPVCGIRVSWRRWHKMN